MGDKKLNVFIASSTGGLPYARAVQQNLKSEDISSLRWDQGGIGPGGYLPDDLLSKMNKYDFAIFVFSPDDITLTRDKEVFTTRDNVVFELGLFMGSLGRARCFILLADDDKKRVKLPSDLAGITWVGFTPPQGAETLQGATGSAITSIADKMRDLGQREIADGKLRKDAVQELVDGALHTVCLAASIVPTTPYDADLRVFIFKKIDDDLVCKYYWSAYPTSEQVDITKFNLRDPVNAKFAVVKAVNTKQTNGQIVNQNKQMELAQDIPVWEQMTYVLASPILDKKQNVWGVVDFDTGNETGDKILKTKAAAVTLRQLAEHLSFIFSVT